MPIALFALTISAYAIGTAEDVYKRQAENREPDFRVNAGHTGKNISCGPTTSLLPCMLIDLYK